MLQAVSASPILYSIAHKSMCKVSTLLVLPNNNDHFGLLLVVVGHKQTRQECIYSSIIGFLSLYCLADVMQPSGAVTEDVIWLYFTSIIQYI